MKTVSQSLFLLVIATMFAACSGNQRNKESHDGHDHSKEIAEGTEAKTSVILKDDHLNAVYQHYVHLTKSLTDGNASEAKTAALAIEIGAKEISGGSALAASAARISSTGELQEQRKAFAALSKQMISLLKRTGLSSGKLYVVHCPMAMNPDGAYWITSTNEIRNPYFGESMRTCGSVSETIKKAI